jgi:hypothetical protein
MTHLSKRIGALEAKAQDSSVVYHRIIQRLGQTYDEALDEYGRDRIADGDGIIHRRLVTVIVEPERQAPKGN